MLALRRTAISARNRSFHWRAAYRSLTQFEAPESAPEDASTPQQSLYPANESHFLWGPSGSKSSIPTKPQWSCRHLSTQAGAKTSDGEAENDHGFSELDESNERDVAEEQISKNDGVLSSEANSDTDIESPDHEADELDFDAIKADEKDQSKKSPVSALVTAVMNAPRTNPLSSVLDKFVEDGHKIDHRDVSLAMLSLRRRHRFQKALQLLEWVQEKKLFDFAERNYASHLDLIAKIHGLHKAENYISKIPEIFRTEVIYRTLLANCVSVSNLMKAEEIFNKIRDLGFPLTSFSCNQLLLLYKKVDKKKIADVLLMMEKENIKPTVFTYRLLIDLKGRSNDIEGMEQTIKHMEASGVVPDLYLQADIARHYIYVGSSEKAESILKEMEGNNLKPNRFACKSLLPLYAYLGKEDDVARVWSNCEENPHLEECVAAIEAWGKLGRIDKAEAVFEHMRKKWNRLSAKYYNAMLKVYANSKNLSKGKELVRQMSSAGCTIGPTTWDALVKLYLAAGEVEKADTVLQKAMRHSPNKQPLYSSYIGLLEKYAKRGDIANSEKIFQKMRKSGYLGRLRMYQCLLEAYIVAKTPAYGFRERMKADNIFPNNSVAGQLNTIEALQKSPMHELLD